MSNIYLEYGIQQFFILIKFLNLRYYNIMNKYITILAITLLFFACKKEEDNPPVAEPITNLNIHFTQTVNGSTLILNEMIYANQATYYSVQTVRYLLSDITLHTDNSTNTLLDEVHFIDITIDSTLSLKIPSIANQNYTSISFTMGLDSIKNQLNSYVNESFHLLNFGWPNFLPLGLGGYHYMQLEGDYESVSQGYATHTGPTAGKDFSFNKVFPLTINETNNIRDIYINMEINNWYQNPEIFNFTTNGIMGDTNSQITLQANGIQDVFSVYYEIK